MKWNEIACRITEQGQQVALLSMAHAASLGPLVATEDVR
jgi:hypothetical protein